MWDANGNWNLDSLSITFPPHIIDSIIAIPKSSHPHQLDTLFWLPSSNGLFTSNSAYLPTLDPPPPFPTFNLCWKWIGNYPPSLASQHSFGLLVMAVSPQKIYPSKGKSLPIPHAPSLGTHLNPSFTSIVSPIWSSLGPIHSLNEFHSPLAFDWIKKITVVNDTPSKYPYILWKFVFPFTAWSIWSAGNKFAMENTPFSPNETIDKTLSLSTDLY